MAIPKWLSWKPTYTLVRNEKQKNAKASDYYILRIDITYTNKSRDKVITAFFNKDMGVTCDAYIRENRWVNGRGSIPQDVKIASCKYGKTWTNVSKCELYPGQSYKLIYRFNAKLPSGQNKFNTNKYRSFKNIRLKHDLQVQTKNL
jgi:hypothetical protein